jgi:hypothetical protein
MEAMKIWLAEYAVFHHHPFLVKHSDENKRCLDLLSWMSLDCSRKEMKGWQLEDH